MKTRVFLVVSLILGASLADIDCRKRNLEWKGTIAEKNGIFIVKNPKKPVFLNAEFKFERDLIIGQASGKPEYLFSQIREFDVDSKGNIYVIDLKENNIRVFDKNGAYIRTVGRSGQGPAEFTEPGNVHVTDAGEIMVTDGGSQCVKVFSSDGTYRRRYLLRKFYPMKSAYGPGNIYYFMSFSQEPPGFQLFRYDNRAEESESLAVWKMSPPDPKIASMFDPYMSFSVMPGDRLVYGCPIDDYEIQVFNPQGRLERKIFRDFDRLAILAQEKQAILNQRKKLPERQRLIDFPKLHAPYLTVNNDDDGHIIVQAFSEYLEDPSKTSESVFDIFDKEGRYLAQIRHPFKGLFEKPIIWKKGKMYTVEQDEEGYPSIVRYSVEGLASLAIHH
jgi:6-bladed beta-propeller